eukprot:TRINITY_DN12308_c0_g1_i1.p1 TRINITY_DN12308_c0_g1~~TRINITY_DN12308_c0_g1_i1.p1  ORF type:complete len:118 (+),score=16.71 TRINITY_DN12308_c0_g1_i1:228-581(+)
MFLELADNKIRELTSDEVTIMDDTLRIEKRGVTTRRRDYGQIKQVVVKLCAKGTFEKCWNVLEQKSPNQRVQLKMPRMVGENLHRGVFEVLEENVISAQCSECQREEIQLSAGKRRE